MVTNFYELLLNASVLALAVVLIFYLRSNHRLPLPPSPKSDPIIGHLRCLLTNTAKEHVYYAKLSKELNSDIISLTVLGQTIIVLNSAKAAHELLDRRSTIYSDRPKLPMLSHPDLVDWGKFTGFIPYGERWRSQRRVSHTVLHKKASMQLWPSIIKESRLTLQRLLKNPDNFFEDFRRMTGSAMLSAVYGYEVTSAHDPFVEIIETGWGHMAQAAVPGNFFVNVLPWLRFVPDWFPGTNWKKLVKEWRTEKEEMVGVPFDWTRKRITQGTAAPSILKTLLHELENNTKQRTDLAEEIDIIKWTTGTLYGAGAHTSSASIFVFVLAMTLYPEVQSRARAEIDQVIGKDRLPEMEDRGSLPYLECMLKEVFRWQSVLPLGVAHACIEDDEYAGYRIPKGATIIANTWAISNDSSVYPNPEVFNPDRFLDSSLPSAPAFGFGRRLCPGIHTAESTLFINMCYMLAVFQITPTRDELGNVVLPSVSMKTSVALSSPNEFKCCIKPRSQRAIELINSWV